MKPNQPPSRYNLRSHRRHYANNAGFTLIELMVTIVIAGVMIALAGTSFLDIQRDTDFDGVYGYFRNSFSRCRAESFNSPFGVTIATTLVVYPNGYACVAWSDLNNDRNVGNKGSAPNAGGTLDVGDAAGEIQRVFFQERFNRQLDWVTADDKAFIDFNHAWNQLPLDGDPKSGYAYVLSPTGYLLAANRTVQLGGTTTQGRLVLNRATRRAAGVSFLPSGQVLGGTL